jgi:uncharacterized protein YciI
MKKLVCAIFLCLSLPVFAQQKAVFDQALADSLGADKYGMKPYILVILKTGPATIERKSLSDSLFTGHISNIGRLAREGKLVVAGPMRQNDKQYRGIFIFNVRTIEEGRALLETDPAVKAGIFEAELYQWSGSAALPMYLDFHNRIEKQ